MKWPRASGCVGAAIRPCGGADGRGEALGDRVELASAPRKGDYLTSEQRAFDDKRRRVSRDNAWMAIPALAPAVAVAAVEVASLPMKPPIVCNDSPDPTSPGDLGVYDSIEWAEKGHEPYDAEDPAIQLYDSEGRLLKMQALWATSAVRIEPAEVEPTHLDRLTLIVKMHLLRIDAPAELADRPLAEMLQYIYETDPNPYSGYRRPGDPQRGFWARLVDVFTPAKRR